MAIKCGVCGQIRASARGMFYHFKAEHGCDQEQAYGLVGMAIQEAVGAQWRDDLAAGQTTVSASNRASGEATFPIFRRK